MKKLIITLTVFANLQGFALDQIDLQCRQASGFYGFFSVSKTATDNDISFFATSGLDLDLTEFLQDLNVISMKDSASEIGFTIPKNACSVSAADTLEVRCRAGSTNIWVRDLNGESTDVLVDSIELTTKKELAPEGSDADPSLVLNLKASVLDGCQFLKSQTGQAFPITGRGDNTCRAN